MARQGQAASVTFPAPGSVAVVLTTYNHAQFLAEALDSVLAQSRPADEIIVVDDGSTDDPAAVTALYPAVRLISQGNQGLSAARNTGLRAATSDAIVFVDADDTLAHGALASGLKTLASSETSVFVFGAYQDMSLASDPIGGVIYPPRKPDYAAFLRLNVVGMHATVTYRRQLLLDEGGFDVQLPRCEDYDAYLRLSGRFPVSSHQTLSAYYRRHDQSMSRHLPTMRQWALEVQGRHENAAREAGLTADWEAGRNALHSQYTSLRARLSAVVPSRLWWRLRTIKNRLLRPIDFGSVRPTSDDFGHDRGLPIDRHYVEGFYGRQSADIAGRVLEIGDDSYSRRFGGGRIVRQDVLHVHDAPGATIVGDMAAPGVLPDGAFDCVVLSQTLHLLYDMSSAVQRLHDSMKPGGVALVTVPGITPIDRNEWGSSWYWSLTRHSAQKLFDDVFGVGNVTVEVHGNVYSAIRFLHGLAVEEVDRRKLDVVDESFPVTVAIRAVRALP